MSINDFMLQFDKVVINKVFPENWEVYSIEGEWAGKTNGGRCPTNYIQTDKKITNEKSHIEKPKAQTKKSPFL